MAGGDPDGWVCCGRPLYDFGFIGQARGHLRQEVDADVLRPALRDGMPIVGLEPICVAAFRDELVRAQSRTAGRHAGCTKQTYLLSEFLAKVRPDYQPPRLEAGKAVVHGHCQQKAVLDMDAEIDALRATGLDVDVLESGCCGMAGNFGFEKRREVRASRSRPVSASCCPRYAGRTAETYVVATGFSVPRADRPADRSPRDASGRPARCRAACGAPPTTNPLSIERKVTMAKTAADVLIETLIDWGVDTSSGCPGDGINGIMESLRTHQDEVRFVQVRHEEAAAFAPRPVSKFSGSAGRLPGNVRPGRAAPDQRPV